MNKNGPIWFWKLPSLGGFVFGCKQDRSYYQTSVIMKTLLIRLWIIAILLASTAIHVLGDAPNYRGKVVLIVDNTMATNPIVIPKIERLAGDLEGDGWHVLQHNVDRGPDIPDEGNRVDGGSSTEYTLWAVTNAYRIREIRALIKADYDTDPTDVKNVFLIGHVPVPYSGLSGLVDGGHYPGAEPADTFYGDMDSKYGPSGWTDLGTALASTAGGPLQSDNLPEDGKFDQDYMLVPMKIGVGRIDLSRMSEFETNEAGLISGYFDKDHDFRTGNLSIQRRALIADRVGCSFTGVDSVLEAALGSANVPIDDTEPNSGVVWHWFPNVSTNGQDYLLGCGGGQWVGDVSEGIGYIAGPGSDGVNDFYVSDSRVVFLNLYGSFFGNWEDFDFLRAPLANQYDPASGRFGYGLDSLWGPEIGLDTNSLTERILGATIGQAIYIGYTGCVNSNLMGDPTLRMYNVLPPSDFTILSSSNTIALNWVASSDTNLIGYNIYWMPTHNGPFTLVNTNGPINASNYTMAKTSIGNIPDNFYMVRAVKLEATPVGEYTNMSEGVITNTSGDFTAYLNILSGPTNSDVVVNTGDGTTNAAAFTVDAVGIDGGGDESLIYQWYRNGVVLTNSSHISGSTNAALLISGVCTNDSGNYYVVVGLADGSQIITNSPVSLIAAYNPTANNDSYTVIRGTSESFSVLTNDVSTLLSPSMSLVSIANLSNPNAGSIAISPDNTTILFTPSLTFLGTVTFTYIMTDGVGTAQATVTITIVPNPGDVPPAISAMVNQAMDENSVIYVPFTVNDLFTSPDNLVYTVSSSNQEVIPGYNVTLFGSGTNRMMGITGGFDRSGTTTVTLGVTDYDLMSSTNVFTVTVTPDLGLPQLGSATISSGVCSFGIAGPAGSYWNIYSTLDFSNWTDVGGVTLSSSGTNSFTDDTVSGVTNRFYILSNGAMCSQIIGFTRVAVETGYTLIANQLDASPDDTLNSVFAQTVVPNGTLILIPIVAGSGNYTYYTNIAGVWFPNGNATLPPGGGAFIFNPTNAFNASFVGLVREGSSSVYLTNDVSSMVSSVVPRAGGLQSTLGYVPNVGDGVYLWDQTITNWDYYQYIPQSRRSTNYIWSPSEPMIGIGQAFTIDPSTNITWQMNFSPGCN
jgi:hypothetical protein